MAKVVHQCSFAFNNSFFVEYRADAVGDELPLHRHTFNHLLKVTAGEVECFTDDGVVVKCVAGDEPIEFTAGRLHGARALTAGAMFLNIYPERGP